MSESAPTPDRILRRLEWTVIRRLDGLLHGDYRTLFRGAGLDLADLREYQYHDDVRHIDWNVTARLQTPYVREYNEEREVAAWFLLDLSPSVDFGSQQLKKEAVSSEFVAVLEPLVRLRVSGHPSSPSSAPSRMTSMASRFIFARASTAESGTPVQDAFPTAPSPHCTPLTLGSRKMRLLPAHSRVAAMVHDSILRSSS
jgi:uncharacterized protein (DUF58 family)